MAYNRALWVGVLCAALMVSVHAATPAPTSALVTVAEGAPFTFTRGATMYTATKGVSLIPGDLIESKPESLLILEFRAGTAVSAVVAIGPSTRAYWMGRREGVALAVLSGWVKVDTPSGQNLWFKVQGAHLGAASSAGTYIVHAGEALDEVYHESGTMTLWVPKPDGTGMERNSKLNEFLSRVGTGDVQTQQRPSAAFNDTLPATFRDPLPTGLSAQLHGKVEPKPVRDVSYDDVSAWLGAPRDWRKDFIGRFRPRLKDPAFFHALDVHLSAHPEWDRILHPPPPAAAAR